MLQSRKDDYIQRLIKRFFEALNGLVDKRAKVPDEDLPGISEEIGKLYPEFFGIERAALLQGSMNGLGHITADLDVDLIRPLAILLYQDAMAAPAPDRVELLRNAKWLFDDSYQKTGQLLLEDLSILADIDARIATV